MARSLNSCPDCSSAKSKYNPSSWIRGFVESAQFLNKLAPQADNPLLTFVPPSDGPFVSISTRKNPRGWSEQLRGTPPYNPQESPASKPQCPIPLRPTPGRAFVSRMTVHYAHGVTNQTSQFGYIFFVAPPSVRKIVAPAQQLIGSSSVARRRVLATSCRGGIRLQVIPESRW